MVASLWVALGGALGSVGRYWLSCFMEDTSKTLPWNTILINISGSFLIAFFAAFSLALPRLQTLNFITSDNARLFIMVGLCGGFTTFSSFSLQTVTLLRDGAVMRAFLNIGLSVVLCLTACAVGWYLGEKFNH